MVLNKQVWVISHQELEGLLHHREKRSEFDPEAAD